MKRSNLRRDTEAARAFQQRGRESSAKSLSRRAPGLSRKGFGRRGDYKPRAYNEPDISQALISEPTCWLAQFDPEVSCDDTNHLDRCHILPKQFLRRIGVEDIWDPDFWVFGCRRHHYRFDNYFFRPRREDLPEGIERRADQNAAVAARLSRDFRRRPPMEAAA